jgi:hypothetical protein
MKKLFALSVCMLLATIMVRAQKIQFGLKGGLAFASQSISDPSVLSTNSITSYNIYALGRYQLKNDFYLQLSAGICGKGVITYENVTTSNNKLTYLDFPLDFLYKASLPKIGKAYFGAGPYLSIGLSGNQVIENGANNPGSSLYFGNNGDYNTLDAGLSLIGGIELNNHLTFNLNYELGLNNLATGSQIEGGTTTIKNRVFSVGLGLMFE